MNEHITALRDLFANKEELAEKRKKLKEAALAERSTEAIEKATTEVKEIDNQLAEIDKKIEEIQKNKEENKRDMNTLFNYKEGMDKAEILQTAEYRSAFFKRLQGKNLTDEETRAMTSATASNGAAIPTMTMNSILGKFSERKTALGLVTILNIPELLSLPKENVTTDASWVAEDADGTATDDTLSSISLGAYKLIRLIKVTAKLQAMSIAAFEAWIVETMVKKMNAALDKAIFDGTGTNQPTGLNKSTWDATNSITVAAAASVTADNLIDLEALVGEDYIGNAVWVMNRKTLASIKKLQDSNKKYLFERMVEDGFRGTILGIPVALDKNVKDNEAFLGDWKAGFVYNFTQDITLDTSTEAGFMSGSTVYRGMALVDGKPTGVKEAMVKLVKAASA